MSFSQQVLTYEVFRNLNEVKKIRNFQGNTTAAGSSDGKSFVCSALDNYDSSFIVGNYFVAKSGVNLDQRELKIISKSGSTMTLESSAGAQISNSVEFLITDRVIWSFNQIHSWINSEKDNVLPMLSNEILEKAVSTTQTSGAILSTGDRAFAIYPTDSFKSKRLKVDGAIINIENSDREIEFDISPYPNDPFACHGTHENQRGVFYKPAKTLMVNWQYVPYHPKISKTVQLSWEGSWKNILVKLVTSEALKASRDFEEAKDVMNQAEEMAKKLNAQGIQ